MFVKSFVWKIIEKQMGYEYFCTVMWTGIPEMNPTSFLVLTTLTPTSQSSY